MARSVTKTSEIYDTSKQIWSNIKNMSALRHFQMREYMTGNLCWNFFLHHHLHTLKYFEMSSHHHPLPWNILKYFCIITLLPLKIFLKYFRIITPSLEICKGQKIENTRPTLILILRKKENPQSTNSFSSFPQYILYSLQNGIQYSHHC